MDWLNGILATGAAVLQLVLWVMLVWLMCWLFFYWLTWRWGGRRQRFRRDLSLLLRKGDVSWKQLKIIAATHEVESRDIRIALDRLYRTALLNQGENNNAAIQLQRLDGLRSEHRQEEPFDELPSHIRVRLDRLQRRSPDASDLVIDLADQLRDFSVKAEGQRRIQTILAWSGVLVGILSVAWPSVSSWLGRR